MALSSLHWLAADDFVSRPAGRSIPAGGSRTGEVGKERLPRTFVGIPLLDVGKRWEGDELPLV